jgi:hypothetical protein
MSSFLENFKLIREKLVLFETQYFQELELNSEVFLVYAMYIDVLFRNLQI